MQTRLWTLLLAPAFAGAVPNSPAADRAASVADIETPASFRDADFGSWKLASERPAPVSETWWRDFDDPVLTALVERALEFNQDLEAAAARVTQSWAAAGVVAADRYPSLQVQAAGSRGRSLDTNYRDGNRALAPLALGYEIDLWGRLRNSRRAAYESARAQAAQFAAARLSLTANVAQSYFLWRATTREEGIVRATAETRSEARDVVAARLRSGSATELDLARAETELASAEADLAAVRQHRTALQTGLAVLVGEAAPDFRVDGEAIAAIRTLPEPPRVPVGLPGELLERRPDIVAAQLDLAAAHARIGVARAAFFPSITLTGGAGYESTELDGMFSWSQRVWSVGPQLYLPIFQGGRNRANLAGAQAAHDEAVALYRQQILVAFRDVQDALNDMRFLTDQADAQARAVTHARRAAQLSRMRYDAGFVGYLDVVDTERTALGAERSVVQLQGLRLAASVTLFKALGGGWNAADAPALVRR